VWIFFLILLVIVHMWIYFDAKSLGIGVEDKADYIEDNISPEEEQEFGNRDNNKQARGPAGWSMLGIIGLPVYLHYRSEFKKTLQATTEKTCPFCAEQIKAAALVCKHCGKGITLDNA